MLTLNKQEKKAVDKIISAISEYVQVEPMQITPVSVLSLSKSVGALIIPFPVLLFFEDKHRQRRMIPAVIILVYDNRIFFRRKLF